MVAATEDRVEFDYDPLNPRTDLRLAKLVFNDYVESSPEYNEVKGTDIPVIQWRQEFVGGARTRDEDGLPFVYSQNINCEWIDKETQKKRRFGPGGLPNQLALAYQTLGLTASPRDDRASEMLDKWFIITRKNVQMGPYTKRVWFPERFIGDSVPDEVMAEFSTEATKAKDW